MADKTMTIQELKDSAFLIDGEDYGKTQGIPKPFLTLPGAQKIALYYDYGHAFEIQEAVENHQEGFYFYRVICKLLKDDRFIGDMIGACSTHDSGKQNAPPNSILKVAEKRAFVSAVLYVVAGSGLFSADVEDMSPAELGRKSAPETDTALANDRAKSRLSELVVEREVEYGLSCEIDDKIRRGILTLGEAKEYAETIKKLPKLGDSRVTK